MEMNIRGLSFSLLKMIVLFTAVWSFMPMLPVISAEVVDRIVAVVNEDIIRLTDLDAKFDPVADQVRAEGHPPEKEEQVLYDARLRVLDEMINETLADQKIAEAGIHVDDREVDATIERIKQMNYYTDEDLQQALQMRGMTMEKYRTELKQQVLRSKLVNIKVKSSIVITDSDIRKYYETEYGGKKKYALRNIFMAYPPSGESKDLDEVRRQMEEIHQKLEAGASFAEMAKTHSKAPNADEGGQLGDFAIADLSDQLRPVITGLKAGQFSNVIETSPGLQIFYVENIIDTPPQLLEEVRGEIEKKLYDQAVDQKFTTWIESLRQDAHIKIIR